MELMHHPFAPVYDSHSRILILGTFPSVKSRQNDFYYGHPQNRFWPLLAALFEEIPPITKAEKIKFLLGHHIAIWDVAAACTIQGSADSTIENVRGNDFTEIFQVAPIAAVFTNGKKAKTLYDKTQKSPAIELPSTSPANAAYTLPKLIEAWQIILYYLKL